MRWLPLAAALAVALTLGPAPGAPAGAQSLAEALDLALGRVPALDAALARVAAAEARVREAEAGYLPELDLTLAGRVGWLDEPTVDDRRDASYFESEATLELRQMLFDGGLVDAAVDVAGGEAEAAGFAATQAAEELARDLANAYLDAVEAEQAVAIAAAALQDPRRLLALVAEQQQAGLLTPADGLQLAGRAALAEADLSRAEGELQVAAARLAALTGEPPAVLTLPGVPLALLPPDPETALRQALAASPWLAEAAALERARLAEQDRAAARFWPTLDLVVAGRLARDLDGIEGDAADLRVLVELRWTLFDGFGREAEVRRLSRLAAGAQGELLDRRRLLEGRIGIAYARLAEAAGRLAALEPAVQAARETWRLYGEQFLIGRRSLLELLDARRELARLENERLTAALLGPRAAFELGAALGQLRHWIREQDVLLPAPAAVAAVAATPAGPTVGAMTGLLLANLGAGDLAAAPAPPPALPLPLPAAVPLPAAGGGAPVRVAPPVAGKLGAGPGLALLAAALLRPGTAYKDTH